mmetsp:Transcript_3786/g.9226  ORF Transcript_3786/g.9226 Transcript_3786/m.9226 type:complete len:412 (-) Transcript_3786:483-1718(-)
MKRRTTLRGERPRRWSRSWRARPPRPKRNRAARWCRSRRRSRRRTRRSPRPGLLRTAPRLRTWCRYRDRCGLRYRCHRCPRKAPRTRRSPTRIISPPTTSRSPPRPPQAMMTRRNCRQRIPICRSHHRRTPTRCRCRTRACRNQPLPNPPRTSLRPPSRRRSRRQSAAHPAPRERAPTAAHPAPHGRAPSTDLCQSCHHIGDRRERRNLPTGAALDPRGCPRPPVEPRERRPWCRGGPVDLAPKKGEDQRQTEAEAVVEPGVPAGPGASKRRPDRRGVLRLAAAVKSKMMWARREARARRAVARPLSRSKLASAPQTRHRFFSRRRGAEVEEFFVQELQRARIFRPKKLVKHFGKRELRLFHDNINLVSSTAFIVAFNQSINSNIHQNCRNAPEINLFRRNQSIRKRTDNN